MAIGTYTVDSSTQNNWYGTGYTKVIGYSWNNPAVLKSVIIRMGAGGTFDGRVVVYNGSGTLVASSAYQNLSVSSNTEYEFPLTSDLSIAANTVYHIGWYNGTNSASPGVESAPPSSVSLSTTPSSSFTVTRTTPAYERSGDSNPLSGTANTSYRPSIRLSFNLPNTAPTVSVIAPDAVARDNRTSTTFTWTASNPEGDTHNAAEIRYRERGSTGAYTTVAASSTTSHTFAANTFTLGTEYEWGVRVSDSVAGYGDWKNSWFMAGVDTWKYSAEVTSSSTTGTIPNTHKLWDWENSANGVDGWAGNSFFGSYSDPQSLARSTARFRSGAASLLVTWPTDASKPSRAKGTAVPGFVTGAWYLLKGSVYVPSGSPNVIVDPFLQTTVGTDPGLVTTKDAWVDVEVPWQCVQADGIVDFAVKTTTSTTSGQQVYIDNVSITQISPSTNPGNYIVQVRTSDANGFGPWSSSATFVQSPASNIYVKQSDGSWKLAVHNVKEAAGWNQSPPITKI